jgi:glycosyltransferase involved in cell wall biosynthesis
MTSVAGAMRLSAITTPPLTVPVPLAPYNPSIVHRADMRSIRRASHDSLARVVQRWVTLSVVTGFVLLLVAAYVASVMHEGAPQDRLWLAIGAFTGFAVWTIGRPLAVFASHQSDEPAPTVATGVSVVIPCCNASAKIAATVESILRSEGSCPIEVVLVENNSSDDTWQVIAELASRFPQVKAHHVSVSRREYAASVAINYGVRMTSNEAIIRMDDDTVMSSTMIQEAVKQLMTENTSAVAVNLRVLNPSVSIASRLQAIEYMLAMELDRRFQVMLGSVLCCSGGLAAFKRTTVIRSGGFCSAPKWVSEDLDMTMKAHRLGHVRMAHRSVGYTEVPASFRALVKQRYRWGISGVVSFYLHRRGVGRRSYWYDGRVGFFALPILGAVKARDLLALAWIAMPASFVVAGHWMWIGALLLARMGMMVTQIVIMPLILHERQGVRYVWLVPFFVLVYGPILLAARSAGAWTGARDIYRLRRAQHQLEHAGLDPTSILARGLDLAAPAPTESGPVSEPETDTPFDPDPEPQPPVLAPSTRPSNFRPAPLARRFGWQPYAAAAAGAAIALVVTSTLQRATAT